MNLHYYFKLVEPQIRRLSTNLLLNQKSKGRNHYDSLGVSAKATQADIKSAYYKLSMVYHPDKNKDSAEGASEKFRDITEAYEVLGNVQSRRLYDRGLYLGGGASSGLRYDEPVNKFYHSRDERSKPPTMNNRRVIYNFDEWSRSHYGATFARDLRNKERQKIKKMRKTLDAEDIKSEQMVYLVGVVFALTWYVFIGRETFNNDIPVVNRSAKTKDIISVDNKES